jgi:hypothetical protein
VTRGDPTRDVLQSERADFVHVSHGAVGQEADRTACLVERTRLTSEYACTAHDFRGKPGLAHDDARLGRLQEEINEVYVGRCRLAWIIETEHDGHSVTDDRG